MPFDAPRTTSVFISGMREGAGVDGAGLFGLRLPLVGRDWEMRMDLWDHVEKEEELKAAAPKIALFLAGTALAFWGLLVLVT